MAAVLEGCEMSDLTEAPSGEKRVMEEEGGSANKKLCLEKEGCLGKRTVFRDGAVS